MKKSAVLLSCGMFLVFAAMQIHPNQSVVKSATNSPASYAPLESKCFIFYSLNKTDKVGLRNNCEECKVAVINTINAGKSEIKKYRVEAKSQIEINTAQTQQILDDEKCTN